MPLINAQIFIARKVGLFPYAIEVFQDPIYYTAFTADSGGRTYSRVPVTPIPKETKPCLVFLLLTEISLRQATLSTKGVMLWMTPSALS